VSRRERPRDAHGKRRSPPPTNVFRGFSREQDPHSGILLLRTSRVRLKPDPRSYTHSVELRKTVTVLFSDIADSTSLGESLDSEALRRVLGRYFEDVSVVVERHGGRVEKFIGDAVVALFGVPTTREDDALRALRAAAEIGERLEVLNDDFERGLGIRLGVRTGIATGEVFVGAASGDGFTAAGDTMNVAARLEQSAAAGEVLIAAPTRALGGDAIVVEEVGRLELKGKADPVEAFRLVRVLPHASPYGRRDDAPLVGRRAELAALHEAFRHAQQQQECVFTTVVGSAGVGKSRLVREFLGHLDDSARVLVGRCVAYGEGVTFLPLAEALEEVLGSDPRVGVRSLLVEDERAEQIAERVAAALGTDHADGSGEETLWAFRRVFEALARERPLVLVVDDIHWAEPTLLDLLEYVASFSSGAPMLLLCLTRPDVLEERPTWAAPRENATLVVLSPLGEDDATALVGHLSADTVLPEESRRRIVEAADGNPLFLEQLLALNAGRGGNGQLEVPPTIQALLAARIDRLESGERTVLACAAVEGREFHRGSVVELLSDEARAEVGTNLLSLARRQFIRPLRGAGPDVDAFAFVHGLLRDAAYSETPKELRADLHVRLADYLERQAGVPVEIVGHHLAKASRYRIELGLRDETTQELAQRAAERLAAGGRRALDLGDDRAAATLFDHACELVPLEDAAALPLYIDLGRALGGAGELEQASNVFADVRALAARLGEHPLELRAELGLLTLRAQTDPSLRMADLVAAAERALPVFEAARDERGLARAWFLVHWARFRTGRYADSIDAAEKVVSHSAAAGDSREQLRGLGQIAMATLWGPTPVEEGFARCDELVERAGGAQLVDAFADRVRGGFCSMNGDFERGRGLFQRAIRIYEELGHPISGVGVVSELQRLERQAGRLDVAERELRSAYARLRELGDVGYVSWIAAALARVLAEQGAYEEAVELARMLREMLQTDVAYAQVLARLVESSALAAESRAAEAEERALEALALVEQTDMLDLHGDVLVALADLDQAAGQTDAASARRAQGLELYERKGDIVSVARVRERL
jgi:class 3 adenylate cyclase/tetratricopeptide (TPR) repeat protein